MIAHEVRIEVERMLSDGASHREIARTLGVGRHTLKRLYPGTGWTYQAAGEFAREVRRANEEIRRAYPELASAKPEDGGRR